MLAVHESGSAAVYQSTHEVVKTKVEQCNEEIKEIRISVENHISGKLKMKIGKVHISLSGIEGKIYYLYWWNWLPKEYRY